MLQAIFWALIGLVCLSPLPLASNRPLPGSLLALGVGILLVLLAVCRLREPRATAGAGPFDKYAMVFCLGFALLLGWYGLQAAPLAARLAPTGWAHPAWAEAAAALGEPLAGAIGIEPVAGLTLLMKILAYGGIFIMALYFGRDRHRARAVFIAVALASAAYSAYGLFAHFSGTRLVLWFPKTEYIGSVTSTFINRNSFATFAGIGILAALGPLLHEFRRLVAGSPGALRALQNVSEQGGGVLYLLIVSVILDLAALVLTGSRGGFASLAFGLLVFMTLMLALRDVSLRHFIRLLVFAAVVVFGFVAVGGGFLAERLGSEVAGVHDARIDLFDVERLAVAERPLVGQGLASFPAAFNRANDGSAAYDTAWVDLAHNSYLELAIEGGIIGLAGSLMLLGLMVGLLLQGIFTRARGTSFAIAGLAICALVGAHAMVDFSFQMPAVAATFMLLIGAAAGQSLPGAASLSRRERVREAKAAVDDRRRGREALSRSVLAVEQRHLAASVMDDLRRIAADLEALEALRRKSALSETPRRMLAPPEPQRPMVEAHDMPRSSGDREST